MNCPKCQQSTGSVVHMTQCPIGIVQSSDAAVRVEEILFELKRARAREIDLHKACQAYGQILGLMRLALMAIRGQNPSDGVRLIANKALSDMKHPTLVPFMDLSCDCGGKSALTCTCKILAEKKISHLILQHIDSIPADIIEKWGNGKKVRDAITRILSTSSWKTGVMPHCGSTKEHGGDVIHCELSLGHSKRHRATLDDQTVVWFDNNSEHGEHAGENGVFSTGSSQGGNKRRRRTKLLDI